ncbi:MAG: entericidin [Gammaproteobacteria bacterium]
MKISPITISLSLAALLSGCGTIKGAGQDIEGFGEKVQDVATDTEREIKD